MTDDQLRNDISAQMPRAWDDLKVLVACQSVADPALYPPEECAKAAQLVIETASAAGLQDVKAYDTPDGSQAVIGHAPGPQGAPTVLLYCHYDVQPALDPESWESPPFALTERDGRWYGRGAADCKGNIAMHLAALRALQGRLAVNVKFIAEGSEEQGTNGLDGFLEEQPELLRADAIVIGDAGNAAVGEPTLTTTLRGMTVVNFTVSTLASPMHSGMFGGAAPDALTAMIQMLATLNDVRGNAAVQGLDTSGLWDGAEYDAEQFRADATVLDGVDLVGDGKVADMVWARPTVTVLGIDCPPVSGSSPSIQATARARVSIRVPPGLDAQHTQDLLVAHLQAVAPWHVKLEIEREVVASPFAASTSGAAHLAISSALERAYGRAPTSAGQGGSIPLCSTLKSIYPDAEIMLLGVAEPTCLIHAPNESVDPSEIEHMALAEALFLRDGFKR